MVIRLKRIKGEPASQPIRIESLHIQEKRDLPNVSPLVDRPLISNNGSKAQPKQPEDHARKYLPVGAPSKPSSGSIKPNDNSKEETKLVDKRAKLLQAQEAAQLKCAIEQSRVSYAKEQSQKQRDIRMLKPMNGEDHTEPLPIKNELSSRGGHKRAYTAIADDGWCTPWAETLDVVNLYFFGLEPKRQSAVQDLARRLGAGITNNNPDATHIVTPVNISKELLNDVVAKAGVIVGRTEAAGHIC